jgi:C4-dicarboxylate transporter, DctM subunit
VLILLLVLLLMLALGAPIFAVMIGGTALGAMSLPRDMMVEFGGPLADLFRMGTGEQASILSTIPLFIFAGYLMAEAKTADRLVRFAQALIGWLPGGLAVVTVFACAVFTVFSGASGVTIVALGGLVMPALLKQGYPQKFAMGLIGGTGSVGLLFPPALPLFIYGTIYGMAAQTSSDTGVGEMKLIEFSTERFLFAGIVPGMVLCGIICIYAVAVAVVRKVPRQKFSWRELADSVLVAVPELAIPGLIVVSLATGTLTVPETAAVTAVYVFLLETVLFRDIALPQMPRIVKESMALVGAIFIIILCATALTNYFVTAKVPNALVEWITSTIESKWAFLLALNVMLLFVGMLMDIFSAIVVVVPLITPTAMRYGIDPYHLGVVFLLNLELGYLTPPVGLNLFITSFKFNQPVTAVIRATAPFLLMMVVALGVVTYVPALTIVPPAKRAGRISTLVKTISDAQKRETMPDSITLPDGKKLAFSDCEAMADQMQQLSCRGLFRSYGECADDACRAKAVQLYIEETSDDVWDEQGGEEGGDLDLDDLDLDNDDSVE